MSEDKIQFRVEVNGVEHSARSIEELSELVQKTKEEIADRSVSLFGGSAGQIVQGFSALKNGLKVASNGFKTLRGAILSTGLGALIVAFGSLITYFSKTNEGTKVIQKIMGGLGAIVGVLTDKIASLGKWLIDAFKNPQKALSELAEMVKQNLINRFTAFGKILDGIIHLDFKKIGDGVLQAATGVEDMTGKAAALAKEMAEVAKRGYELEAAQQRLVTTTREWSLEETILTGQLEQLIKTGEDQSMSFEERINNLRKAGEIENQITTMNLELAKEQLRIIKEKNAISDSSEEELENEAEAAKKVAELEAKSLNLRQEIQNQISALEKERTAEQEAAAKAYRELLEKRNEFELTLEEKRLNNLVDGEEKQLALLEFNYNKTIAETKKKISELGLSRAEASKKINEAERLLLQEFEQQKFKIREDFEKKAEAEANKRAREALKKKIESQEVEFSKEKLLLTKQLLERHISEQEYKASLERLEIDSLKKLISIKSESGESTLDLEQKLADKELAIINEKNQAIKQAEEEAARQRKKIRDKAVADAQSILENLSSFVDASKQIALNSLEAENRERLNELDRVLEKELSSTYHIELEKQRIRDEGRAKDISETELTEIAKNNITSRAKEEEARINEEFAAKKKDVEKKQADIEFAVKAAQIVSSTALAVAQVNANPAVNADITQTLRAILTALVVGNGAAQLAIANQQRQLVKSMALGGMVHGPSHSFGGVRFAMGGAVTHELEGGEAVLNKRSMAYPAFRAIASIINEAGGGVGFNFNGIRPSGTFGAQSPDPIKVYVLESDITEVQGKNRRIEKRAKVV